jgi:hypothetical protein
VSAAELFFASPLPSDRVTSVGRGLHLLAFLALPAATYALVNQVIGFLAPHFLVTEEGITRPPAIMFSPRFIRWDEIESADVVNPGTSRWWMKLHLSSGRKIYLPLRAIENPEALISDVRAAVDARR